MGAQFATLSVVFVVYVLGEKEGKQFSREDETFHQCQFGINTYLWYLF